MFDASNYKAADHLLAYLNPVPREKSIADAIKNIKCRVRDYGDDFDAIAYRGQSGAILASIIAFKLKKPLLLVRKDEDNKGHSPYQVEGPVKVKRYLIVDDFISSGNTYNAIREAVRKEHPLAECIGMCEVTYTHATSPGREFTKSGDHRMEIDRQARLLQGTANKDDVQWVTRTAPIAPEVKYKPVFILKDGPKYSFQFESNNQKLLPAPEDPMKAAYGSMLNFLKKVFTYKPMSMEPLDPKPEVVEPRPPLSMAAMNSMPTMPSFMDLLMGTALFGAPIARLRDEQKAEAPAEAAVPGPTEG